MTSSARYIILGGRGQRSLTKGMWEVRPTFSDTLTGAHTSTWRLLFDGTWAGSEDTRLHRLLATTVGNETVGPLERQGATLVAASDETRRWACCGRRFGSRACSTALCPPASQCCRSPVPEHHDSDPERDRAAGAAVQRRQVGAAPRGALAASSG